MPILYPALLDSIQLTRRAGVFQGGKPNEVSSSDPLSLFVIQASFIIIFTRAIGYLLAKMRQPRVIAELIGGIILGPSIFGQIPNYMDDIFPEDSLPYLNLIGTLGIILFLFIIGMEIDFTVLRKRVKSGLAVASTTLAIPLGAGIALGVGLWKQFSHNQDVYFSHYILFIGIAISITAFPVLCRIQVEHKLTHTPVGAVTMSAGVINDVVGWILLSIIVALINADGSIITLWILLVILGWTLLMVFAIRPLFYAFARRNGSLDGSGPSEFVIMLSLLLVFISSFLTDIVGVHPIFGAFLVGLIMPKEGRFNVIITEKIEDVVMIIFVPIFFGLVGIQTDLSLLNSGTIWGYTILVIAVAFFSKFLSGAVTAKLCRFNVRESGAIGTLMSCKGLVEIIVLNVGLQTSILDRRVFSMMIFMAVITTFITTPMARIMYPSKHRPMKMDEDGEKDEKPRPSTEKGQLDRYLMVMQKMEHVSTLLHFTKLLESDKQQHHIDALRLVELTERTSDALRSETQEMKSDPLLGIFTTFAHLRNMICHPLLSLTLQDNFAETVAEQANESDLVVLPWKSHREAIEKEQQAGHQNPFDTLFNLQSASQRYIQFVRKVQSQSMASTAIYLDQGSVDDGDSWNGMTIFMPFFGGSDDRTALKLVQQLCNRQDVNAIVVRIKKELETKASNDTTTGQLTEYSPHALPDTIYAAQNTQQMLESETADDLCWMECIRVAGGLGVEMREINAPPSPSTHQQIGQEERKTLGELATALIIKLVDVSAIITVNKRTWRMPKIRKSENTFSDKEYRLRCTPPETSKRTGLFERAKIKQKAKETRRKRSRDERRDPTWRNNKKKKADPGIPNSLPFKEEVLAEIEEKRTNALEAREAAKAAKAAGEDVELSESDEEDEVGDDVDDDHPDSIPQLIDSSITTEAPSNFGESVDAADVILQVLDARDPQGFRVEALEKLSKQKKVVVILNKVDLVPKETVRSWFNTLNSLLPTIVFASSAHINPIEGLEGCLTADTGVDALKNLLSSYSKDKKGKNPLKVLVAGLPNVGKSALLNTLIKQPYFKTASVSTNSLIGAKNPTTTTTSISAVNVDGIVYIDSPGLYFIGQSGHYAADILRRNLGRPDKVREPQLLADWILNRSNEEDLMMFFKLPAFASGDYEAFLKSFANVVGRVKKRGVLDVNGAMRDFILKYVKYDMPYYTVAPANDKQEKQKKVKQIKGVTDVVARDIDRLPSRKPMRKARGEVRLVAAPSDATIESREYVPTVGGPVEEESAEEQAEDDEDDEEEDDDEDEDNQDIDVLGAVEDMEEHDMTPDANIEPEAPSSPPPKHSKKRKERAPKVKFAKEVETSDAPKSNNKATVSKIKTNKEIEKPKPAKKAKVEEGVSAKQGLKGKKSDKVEGEAFDFNEFF
ncbi:hypothetical protein E3P89_02170 [Wallemia ichthyophaga]|uniref:Cation/H+ exchanger domain-containing protein n=1 Tax=Wallemia ichthyophaga TaxID=245174 RepID=A0A4T0H8F1_WALIC|nr:hypothetical protein E3P90_02305 [Wallemia ichthyophaga]TIB13090.1 hypothetical protein E3P93_02065 [Wallemia ichthyophaga]TIB22278.1 hypothetical protein E3P89_02170 [Wallemia ichthyophaga]TIB24019.1 hypothetical protein E3P88_02261 [Wallemia ichthyophaga]